MSFLLIPIALTVIANLLYFIPKTARLVTNKAVFVAVLSLIVFSLQGLVYPSFVGRVLPVDSLTTTGPMVSVFYAVTLVGGALLALMIGLYVYVAMRQNRLTPMA